jgi:hypothetical protein
VVITNKRIFDTFSLEKIEMPPKGVDQSYRRTWDKEVALQKASERAKQEEEADGAQKQSLIREYL